MDAQFSLDQVLFPPVGIAHITNDISDLVRNKMDERDRIVVNSAAQPNGYPHLGTVLTLMTGFAIGRHLGSAFSVPVEFTFDELENAPSRDETVSDGISYQRSLEHTLLDGVPLAEKYMVYFQQLLTYLSQKTGIDYVIRSYRQFQRVPVVRRTLIRILQRREEFMDIVSPSERHLHMRFPCPTCYFMDKTARSVKLEELREDVAVLSAICFQHGRHYVTLREDSDDFVDANTPLRELLKGAEFAEDHRQSQTHNVMVDGGDWSGVWALRIAAEGLSRLGYRVEELATRFFAPVIVDWSGAKFSKSLYVSSNSYDYLPKGFIDLSTFLDIYGEAGLDRLWQEAVSWAEEPRKLFRNYSVQYMRLILGRS